MVSKPAIYISTILISLFHYFSFTIQSSQKSLVSLASPLFSSGDRFWTICKTSSIKLYFVPSVMNNSSLNQVDLGYTDFSSFSYFLTLALGASSPTAEEGGLQILVGSVTHHAVLCQVFLLFFYLKQLSFAYLETRFYSFLKTMVLNFDCSRLLCLGRIKLIDLSFA